MPGFQSSGDLRCVNGEWSLPGACIPHGASTSTRRVVQLSLTLRASRRLGAGFEGFDWALANQDVIAAAVATVLDVDAGDVTLEIVQDVVPSKRRLSATDGLSISDDRLFQMRLGIADPPADAVVTKEMLVGHEFRSDLAETITNAVNQDNNGVMLVELFAVGDALLIESYVLPNPVWLISDWSTCAQCGEGFQVRNVSCASGNRLACDARSPLPEQRQTCVDYSQCPFDASCPFGKGRSLGCVSQQGMILAPLALICMCTVGRFVQRGCRPPDSGHVTVASLRMRFAYKVERRAQPATLSKQEDTEACIDAGACSADKVRITWNIDVPKVQEWFEQQRRLPTLLTNASTAPGSTSSNKLKALPWAITDDDCFAESALVGSMGPGCTAPISTWCKSDDRAESKDTTYRMAVTESARVELSDEDLESQIEVVSRFLTQDSMSQNCLEESSHSFPTSTWRRRGSMSTPTAANLVDPRSAVCAGSKIFTAYAEGESVEYFSATHARWVPAVIHPELVCDGVVAYNLTLSYGRQTRANVPLESLRLPLNNGELIEIYSMRNCGTWLPAVVCGQLGNKSTTLGYTVQLHGSAGRIERVPAVRLRRRFEPGDVVSVYKGPSSGWVSTKVHAATSRCTSVASLQGPTVKPLSLLDETAPNLPDPAWYKSSSGQDLPTYGEFNLHQRSSSKSSSRGVSKWRPARGWKLLDHQVDRLLFNSQSSSNLQSSVSGSALNLPHQLSPSIVDTPAWIDVLVMSSDGVRGTQTIEYVKSYLVR